MALKVELRPHERIIVGNCVITNTDQRARLLIDGGRPAWHDLLCQRDREQQRRV